jgi:hypothetical protein
MNYGIINNRRHAKGEGTNKSPFMSDVRFREIAKQMGIDPKQFGQEAQNMWNMLDDLAQNDPKGYQDFINNQLKDGLPINNQTVEKKPRFFYPNPGFVVKCMIKEKQQKIFLNCCANEIIDIPTNPNSGKPVPKDTKSVPNTSNLQIPLVIGSLRTIKDFSGTDCCAIDVVFHPWVLERCEWDTNFKREVMKLATHWVQEDAKIPLVSLQGKFIKSQYKGGIIAGNNIITAKFFIESEESQNNSKDMMSKTNLGVSSIISSAENNQNDIQDKQIPSKNAISIDSPEDLLKQINISNQEDTNSFKEMFKSSDDQKSTKATTTCKSETKSKKLIEVIEPEPIKKSEKKTTFAEASSSSSSVIKKGFLNSKKIQLYPKGSNEGLAPSPYVKLLSRSKVVDLNSMEQQKAQKIKLEEEEKEKKKQMFSFLQDENMSSSTNNKSEEKDFGDYEFMQLCEEADPDLRPSRGKEEMSDESQSALEAFTKFLSASN